ncbi:MAG TPA: M1 family metallopeptidase [Chitinophagales bacterium]|nr:M1 family metallopeptidase [Chitinophagales bacterium]
MKHPLTILCFCFSMLCHAQQAGYWQQQTNYKIDVSLNDTLHELDGFLSLEYSNNSPQPLDYIIFHLWPNAYKDHTTPFAQQQVENGDTKFYYSKPHQRGYIDKLDFKVNAEVSKWEYDGENEEICKVYLNKPLASGEKVRISTPFHVKLPATFSRMGHVGQSYQVTQWYPKPAVYDKTGWHAMPYLDQGEFYSEFGSYEVNITLPQNYVVGATGDLQNTGEMQWLDSIAIATSKIDNYSSDMSFPASAKQTKTITYKQNNIHDFGWFADKRYHVLKGEVELPYSKKKVTTWAMFTNDQAEYWSRAPEYIHDAVFYYSKWIGEYPYAQVTALEGALDAGGGMEYPNVTVIGEVSSRFSLDNIIAHEVGHNWFYGILASNERDHTWMDEGVNSYYEYRYTRTKYPNQRILPGVPKGIAKSFDIAHYKHKYLMDVAYQFMARENRDEPLAQPAQDFTDFNYGVCVYGKSMLIFDYLEAYLGTEKFDAVMKKYFETWKYKHPQPEDIRAVFETETGKDLSWFFDDLIKTTKKIDYKIKGIRKSKLHVNDIPATANQAYDTTTLFVELLNKGGVNSPVKVSYLLRDSILSSVWLDGFKKDTAIVFSNKGIDRIQIDPLLEIPEINRKNNTYKLNKLAHRFEKIRFQFLGSIENQNRTQIFWAPYIGWNNYDKFQVGLAFYNSLVPAKKFNYLVVPVIGTGSRQFNGFARLNYNFYPDKLQRFTVGVFGKRFSYILFPQPLMFNKLEPYINIEFKNKKSRSPYVHSLNMRSAIIWLDWIRFDNDKKETQRYFVNEYKYTVKRNSTLHPFNVNVAFRQGNSFANISAEGNFIISYKRKDEGFRIRVFAGGFIVNSKSTSDISSPNPRFYLSNATTNNFAYWLQKDYMFDENFLDRNGRDPYLGRQIAKTDGAFRSFTNFGATNKFLMALNLTSSTHRFFPINPFVNTAFIVNDLGKPQFAAELGLSAILLRDMIEIHLPLVTTKNISDNQKVLGINKWYQKFTFTLKLQLSRPMDLIRRFM